MSDLARDADRVATAADSLSADLTALEQAVDRVRQQRNELLAAANALLPEHVPGALYYAVRRDAMERLRDAVDNVKAAMAERQS